MMKRTTLFSAVLVAGLALGTGAAQAAGESAEIEDFSFSFEGPFGSYEQDQLQRGFQVYTEICSGCHGLQYVPFRALEQLGYTDQEVRAYAENWMVADDSPGALPGDERPAKPTDYFPANNSVGAPDLTLMAKARAGFHGPAGLGINQFLKGMGGPEYIANLMTGYVDPPECAADAAIDGAYNKYFTAGGYPDECKDEKGKHTTPGSWISMYQPLYGDDVTYADGTEATLEQEAKDVSAFLMWAAEPNLPARKSAGITAVGFLALLTVLLYLTNKKLWAPVKHRKQAKAEAKGKTQPAE